MLDTMRMGLGERSVTVKRTQLLATLIENREKHRAEYLLAVAGYKDMATKKLATLHGKAKASLEESYGLLQSRIDKCDPTDEDNALNDQITLISAQCFTLKVPKDHTKSYDVAIKMAEWEVNENVTLEQAQFQCFVLDDWDWQQEFRATTKMYSGR